MSALTVNNVRVAGLSACVPEKVEDYCVNRYREEACG